MQMVLSKENEGCPKCGFQYLIDDNSGWGFVVCPNCKWYPTWMPYDNDDFNRWKGELKINKI